MENVAGRMLEIKREGKWVGKKLEKKGEERIQGYSSKREFKLLFNLLKMDHPLYPFTTGTGLKLQAPELKVNQ